MQLVHNVAQSLTINLFPKRNALIKELFDQYLRNMGGTVTRLQLENLFKQL